MHRNPVMGASSARAAGGPWAARNDQALKTFYSDDVHGGYLAAGTAMRNLGRGHVRIGKIPEGATVRAAYLLWDVLDIQYRAGNAAGVFAGEPIEGTLAGTGKDPCWSAATHNYAYVADVTPLVTGNARYELSHFASGEHDGQDPWSRSLLPMIEGATLIVVYDGSGSPVTHVVLAAGATRFSRTTVSTTFDGFTVPDNPAAKTTFAVADGQDSGDGPTRFNGTPLHPGRWNGEDHQFPPDYSLGNLWDTRTYDVSAAVAPGQTSATASLTGTDDCLVWVGQALSIGAAR